MEEFGKWRSFFWPVHRTELNKFVPLLFICFFITLNYNLLRIFKDSLLVTARGSGAEALPFIKVWAVLPMAVLFTVLFTRLSHRFSKEKVFYIMISIFLSFFLLFTFVLYPMHDALHPHRFADFLQTHLPSGCKGLIALVRNWTFTLCYIMADLWSSAILTVLFWSFTNEVTNVQDAKRCYGILAIGANSSAVLSGSISIFFSQIPFIPALHYGTTSWDQCVLFMNATILVSGVLTLLFFRYLTRTSLVQTAPVTNTSQNQNAEQPKTCLRQQLSYLLKSNYLICIALIVLTYNIAIHLVEVVWKNQMKELYPDPSAYNSYMGQVMMATGIISTVVSVLLTSNILRKCSWTLSALIPPIITLITGGLFFLFALFPNSISLLGFTPLVLSVTFGSLQNCLARSLKYTLFDGTKELAFVPLESEVKLKGKAVIDGIGSRFGKSGGAVIHQSFLLVFATVAGSMPYIAAIFLFVALIWIWSVKSLGKKFDRLVKGEREPEPEYSLNPS